VPGRAFSVDAGALRGGRALADPARVRGTPAVSDEEVRQVMLALHPAGRPSRGDGSSQCVADDKNH
jgi:hypothetical protein